MLTLAMAVASVVGTCSVETQGTVHRTRCRVAADEQSVVAVPVGRRSLAPGMLDVSLEIVTPGYATMRNLTPGGINSASGELLAERGGSCWTDGETRVCLGRTPPGHIVRSVKVPARFTGDWRFPEPEPGVPRIAIDAHSVRDDDGRSWRVTRVEDHDGVAVVHGVATDDGRTAGRWVLSVDPDGDLLLLGSPNALPRQPG